jgi:hypothetical protein
MGAMQITRRSFVAGAAALSSQPAWCAQAEGRVLTPEMFGAKGDGVTNDTRAFVELAQVIRANRGGTVELRKTTYIVGEQLPSLRGEGGWSYPPREIMTFSRLTQPLVVRGNGARLRCADGLRYGTFDARSGRATKNPMPFLGGERASPYTAMIRVENCSGPIEISDIELDGNVERLRIGGQFGDTGWQIPAWGLALLNNSGSETVRNVYTHHHGQDGIYIDGLHGPGSQRRLISNVRSEFNGRQGCSIVGGRGYVFENCKFNHTGRANVASAPGAGVDIEAEGGKVNRDFLFNNCEFSDNFGCGMVADSGDSEGATFNNCTFVGTTAWSAWPRKPRFRFNNCNFIGAIVQAYGDPNPARAAQFHGCTFRDDPRLSPNGKIALGDKPTGPIADMSDTRNVLFNRCNFLLTHNAVLPWSINVIYRDCRMEQRSKGQAYPRGTFLGRTVINANVDLYNSKFVGEVILNGRRIGA